MIKSYLKGSIIFSLLSICAVGVNMGPLSATHQCLDADAIRSAGKVNREKLGWQYAAPHEYYIMSINSQNYLRILNPDGIKVTTTQSADGKCHHKLNIHGLLIGSCNLNKSDIYNALAKKYNGIIFKTSEGKRLQTQTISPDMVILSEAQKSDDPGLCSYNMSIMGVTHEEL